MVIENVIANYLLGFLVIIISFLIACQFFMQKKIDFLTGSKLGFIFFVGGPCLQFFIFGRIKQIDVPIDNFTSYSSPLLLTVIFLTGLFLFVLKSKCLYLSVLQKISNFEVSKGFLYSFLFIYITLAAYLFIDSGKLSGGHWYSSHAEQFQNSPITVVLSHVKNILRFSLPGICLISFKSEVISRKKFIAILILESIIEMFLSGNRIIMLVSFLAYILAPGRRRKELIILVLLLPLILQLNYLFPIMRGMMWSEGANSAQILNSINAISHAKSDDEASDVELLMSGAFEASNINMANFVISHYPSVDDFFYGKTFILRPVLFFLPKSIWSDRPEGFGVTLGELSGMNVDGLALNSTYIGEAYANFGLISILILPCILWLLNAFLLNFNGQVPQVIYFFCGFAGWRFDLVFIVTAFIFVLMIASLKLIIFDLSNRSFNLKM